MDNVVVGLAEPPNPTDPLRWAADYCEVTGSELTGAVAFRPHEAEVSPAWYDEELAVARKVADKAMDELAARVPHRLELRDGDAGHVILDIARDEGATSVVVGASDDGGPRSLGLGSVAHHVARHLPVPLIVVPEVRRALAGSAIVVGLDGLPADATTLRWALELAGAAGARVRIVYATDPMAMSYPHPYGATVADERESVIRTRVERAPTGGLDVEMEVEVDHPVSALVNVAQRTGASLLVVGRHAGGVARGLLLGRVASELPFRAHRPVAIVPTGR
jgi:nucleotide-binding universal stress UspA family protein